MAAPTSLFDIEVPASLIAHRPLPQRDQSRLMVLHRHQAGWAHHRFDALPALLPPDALLVLNNTRVIPARLEGTRPGGAPCEALLVQELEPGRWCAMVKGARRLRPGDRLSFADGRLVATALRRDAEGRWELAFDEPSTLRERLGRYGEAPLPPYIERNGAGNSHRGWYQTCYARAEGSIAAPTAGFHFTPDVFGALRARGIGWSELTLHVGVGTFLPIQNRDAEHHKMHREWFEVPPETCRAVAEARRAGRPVVAVGTTTVRALESWARAGLNEHHAGHTELFLRPGDAFLAVDGLITNFHQPASTLLQLVAAFHGEALILEAYREAIARAYRFFSYGDCMLILPAASIPLASR